MSKKREDIFKEATKIENESDLPKVLSNLHYSHFFLMDRYKKILSTYDLSLPQSNILGIIGHFAPEALSLEEIKVMVLEPNADVSRIVTRLVDKGYAIKVPNPKNKRKVSIILTDAGQKLWKKLEADKKFLKFTSVLTVNEAKTFVKVLSKIRNS